MALRVIPAPAIWTLNVSLVGFASELPIVIGIF
jgi:hypothetical protein